MIEDEIKKRIADFNQFTPKYIRKRFKTKEELAEYLATSSLRGWAFLGITREAYDKSLAELRAQFLAEL